MECCEIDLSALDFAQPNFALGQTSGPLGNHPRMRPRRKDLIERQWRAQNCAC